MTIVARRRRVIATPRHRPGSYDRLAPFDARDKVARDLARIALDVVIRTVDPTSLPPRWATTAFAREVAAVRAQLVPIHSRESLADSFGREAAVAATSTPPAISPQQPPGPVRVAYSIPWLELGDDRLRPSWTEWTGQPTRPALDQTKGEITT